MPFADSDEINSYPFLMHPSRSLPLLTCWTLLVVLPVSVAAKRIQVAVVAFSNEGLLAQQEAIFTNKIRDELTRRDSIEVVERSAMDEILKEQTLQQSGCIADDCVVQTGQLLGVDHIVAGSIHASEGTFYISARLIDVATGRILRSANRSRTTSFANFVRIEGPVVAGLLAGDSTLAAPVPEATQKASRSLRAIDHVMASSSLILSGLGNFYVGQNKAGWIYLATDLAVTGILVKKSMEYALTSGPSDASYESWDQSQQKALIGWSAAAVLLRLTSTIHANLGVGADEPYVRVLPTFGPQSSGLMLTLQLP